MKNLATQTQRIKALFESTSFSDEEFMKVVDELTGAMLDKYNNFINEFNKLKTEEERRKELLKFYVYYAKMSNSVFKEILKRNDAMDKKDIQILRNQPTQPNKQISQYTSMYDISRELIHLIKVLEREGVESIDDVLFNGAKIQIELPKK